RMRGGVAGNIAYSLALLGQRPLIVGSVGQDFGEYREWMGAQNIDASGIQEIEDEFTASCFIHTDKADNQIVSFYTGAMAHTESLTLEGLGLSSQDLVVISPTEPEIMTRYAEECRKMDIPFVFDPGKQTPRLEGEQILAGLDGASVLIANDYELSMMARETGKSEEELISSAPLTVITRGEKGSTIYDADGQSKDIPVASVSDVVDPTGAGDAYLAGVVFGISQGYPVEVIGQVATLAAGFVVERRGCQEHHYTQEEFVERYVSTFGGSPEVEALVETVK
ncbi:MAG: carbohydrate kinase family protein, partial [Rubrobacter sp.]|nr:carbohydrate kinase family protein [Rubrobacter sp.]